MTALWQQQLNIWLHSIYTLVTMYIIHVSFVLSQPPDERDVTDSLYTASLDGCRWHTWQWLLGTSPPYTRRRRALLLIRPVNYSRRFLTKRFKQVSSSSATKTTLNQYHHAPTSLSFFVHQQNCWSTENGQLLILNRISNANNNKLNQICFSLCFLQLITLSQECRCYAVIYSVLA